MWEAFRNGGFGMYPTLCFGVFFIWAAVRWSRGELRLGVTTWALGGLTLASGLLGTVTGVIKSLSYLPSQHWLWLVGVGESLNNLALSLVLLILGGIAIAVGRARPVGA